MQLQAYFILDEVIIAGELLESSKKTVHRLIDAQVFELLVLFSALLIRGIKIIA